MSRFREWRLRGPPWQRAIFAGLLYGAFMTYVFGRGSSWLSISLGLGGALVFGFVMLVHMRRVERERRTPD